MIFTFKITQCRKSEEALELSKTRRETSSTPADKGARRLNDDGDGGGLETNSRVRSAVGDGVFSTRGVRGGGR